MIPRAQVTAWRSHAPWPTDAQVEQDLILSRALVELFGNETVAKLRALYQRKKGRDLYDLWLALTSLEVDDAIDDRLNPVARVKEKPLICGAVIFNKHFHLQKGLFCSLICENSPRKAICCGKQKLQFQAISHVGLIPVRSKGSISSPAKMPSNPFHSPRKHSRKPQQDWRKKQNL